LGQGCLSAVTLKLDGVRGRNLKCALIKVFAIGKDPGDVHLDFFLQPACETRQTMGFHLSSSVFLDRITAGDRKEERDGRTAMVASVGRGAFV
jgi:hypothetical protein